MMSVAAAVSQATFVLMLSGLVKSPYRCHRSHAHLKGAAAGFQQMASRYGAETMEINLQETGSNFDHHIYGPAGEAVPALVRDLIQKAQHTSSI